MLESLLIKLCCSFEIFNPNIVMMRTPISILLNEIETTRYSLPSSMRNPDLGATVTDFMAILESIEYSKFEKFSNVAVEISEKHL